MTMSEEREKILPMLGGYLDGELSESDRRRVQHAVENDPVLAAELALLRKTRELLRGLPKEAAPGDFTARVLAGAERLQLTRPLHGQSKNTPLRWIRYAALAATVVLVASVGLTVIFTLWHAPEARNRLADSVQTSRPKQRAAAPREPQTQIALREAAADEIARKGEAPSSPAPMTAMPSGSETAATGSAMPAGAEHERLTAASAPAMACKMCESQPVGWATSLPTEFIQAWSVGSVAAHPTPTSQPVGWATSLPTEAIQAGSVGSVAAHPTQSQPTSMPATEPASMPSSLPAN
jgi:hypothetical protein